MLHLDSLFNTDIMDEYVSMEHTFTEREAEEMFSENVMLKFNIIENQSNILIANVSRLTDMYDYVCTFGVDERFARMHNCKGMLSDLTNGIIPSCEAWDERDINKYTKACMEGFISKIGEAIRWVITKIKDIFTWIFNQLLKFVNWLFGLTPQIDKKCDKLDKDAAALDAGKTIDTPEANAKKDEASSADKVKSGSSDEVMINGTDMKEVKIIVDQLEREAKKTYASVDQLYDEASERCNSHQFTNSYTVRFDSGVRDHEMLPGRNKTINVYHDDDAFRTRIKEHIDKNIDRINDLIDQFKDDDKDFKKLSDDLKKTQKSKTLKLVKGYIKGNIRDHTDAVRYVNDVVHAILDRFSDKLKRTRKRIKEIEDELDKIQNAIALRKMTPDAIKGVSTQLQRELELHKKIAKRLNCISQSCAQHTKVSKDTIKELQDALTALNEINKKRNKQS